MIKNKYEIIKTSGSKVLIEYFEWFKGEACVTREWIDKKEIT